MYLAKFLLLCVRVSARCLHCTSLPGPPAPFKLSTSLGDTTVTLTRDFKGEKISVDARSVLRAVGAMLMRALFVWVRVRACAPTSVLAGGRADSFTCRKADPMFASGTQSAVLCVCHVGSSDPAAQSV
jgi:hypothetical protein